MMKKKTHLKMQADAAAADAGAEEETPDIVVDEDAAEPSARESEADEAGRAQLEAASPTVEGPPPDDRFLRLQADFENFRKRTMRERESLYQRANADLISELLPVLDHLELALQAAPSVAEARSFVDGVQLVFDQALAALGKFGLTPIKTDGQAFDPAEHEAISHLPSPDKAENQIMAQTRRGYRLGDRVLRAAQVVVSSGLEKQD
jgi:molecular chaperone GrpE